MPGWSEGPDLRCAIAHRGISRFRVRANARPGMTMIVVDELFRRFLLAAGGDALVLARCAFDARLDETIEHLNDDTALFFGDRRDRAAADRRRNLLKRENKHFVSPRRLVETPLDFPPISLDELPLAASPSIPS